MDSGWINHREHKEKAQRNTEKILGQKCFKVREEKNKI